MQVRLPSPDRLKVDEEIRTYLAQLVQAIERALERLPETPLTRDRIKITNLTRTYTLDATTTTPEDIAAVLGTFLSQLQDAGTIS